jgi:hypothetical protein
MTSIILQTLDSNSILLKGLGRNQRLEPITVDKVPGSIVIESVKYSSKIRIYCIYEYSGTWVFAVASEKEHKNVKPFDFFMDQSWDAEGRCRLEISVPSDTKLTLDGEFSED